MERGKGLISSDSCSATATSCPSGINVGNITIPDPPLEYWSDEIWCEGASNCSGRQKAPMCSSGTSSSEPSSIDWVTYKSIFSQLIDANQDNIYIYFNKEFKDYPEQFIKWITNNKTYITLVEEFKIKISNKEKIDIEKLLLRVYEIVNTINKILINKGK
mgnify:CR=1 FL=1